jgi:DNA-binding CsgD family transcriptional regulator
MSSVPKMAVARASGFPADPPSPPRGLHVVPSPDQRDGAILRAALEASDRALPVRSLSGLWNDCVGGRLRVCLESAQPGSILLVVREVVGGRCLHPTDESWLRRVLCGEQQKALALEGDIASSTLSTRYNRAIRELGITRREVPVLLALAAQSAAGAALTVSARMASFEQDGARYGVVGIPRPTTECMMLLSPAEQEVARWVIEGCSRREIAARRGTTKHTASRQIHSIFARLDVSNRYALIRRAAELRCFCSERS